MRKNVLELDDGSIMIELMKDHKGITIVIDECPYWYYTGLNDDETACEQFCQDFDGLFSEYFKKFIK